MATFVLVAVFQKIFGLKIILTQHSFKLEINIDIWLNGVILVVFGFTFLDNSSSLG